MIVTILSRAGSRSARVLEEQLNASNLPCRIGRINPLRARRCRDRRYVINWGCYEHPQLQQRELIWSNTPEAVQKCRDKISTLHALREANVPRIDATYARGEMADNGQFDEMIFLQCEEWLRTDGKIVVRHNVTGHSGQGIQIFRQQQLAQGHAIPDAPLYTRYFRKNAEYRLHVGYGNVILTQQKRRANGAVDEDDNHLIRTHENGYVFTVNNLSCDTGGNNYPAYRDELNRIAIQAASAVGAAHCAVDLLVRYRGRNNTPNIVVCEINSAPAIRADSTAEAYRNLFANKILEIT